MNLTKCDQVRAYALSKYPHSGHTHGSEALNDRIYRIDNAVTNTRRVSWNLPHMDEELTDSGCSLEVDKLLERDM